MQIDPHPERGSALVYILIAIALLAALTVAFMEPSSQQGQNQNTFRTVSELSSQVEFIRSAAQECVLTFPAGDDSISVTADEPNANEAYPINPNSSHYATAVIGPAGNRNVSGIRCPGNPGNNDENHAQIFSAASGKFLPPPPPLFGPWQWYNDTDGVFFWVATDKSDAYLRTALEKLDEQYAECEADFVDASGGDVSLVSDDATITCPNGSLCFRVWVIVRGTATYLGDSNGDEAGAGC
ncbi:MAG: hypothetical protein HYS17_11530 [Micavibrio aeruginosavorus]|uniref:Uncharacterized protein n=1 Tax=Micavibrio aeruginosavorus TaxID=349221 RepID=A0A7T5R226_9BACT|nr:MAG: hypothetical protein HYS17_11530 [Micavibrio aeruginosavorus]